MFLPSLRLKLVKAISGVWWHCICAPVAVQSGHGPSKLQLSMKSRRENWEHPPATQGSDSICSCYSQTISSRSGAKASCVQQSNPNRPADHCPEPASGSRATPCPVPSSHSTIFTKLNLCNACHLVPSTLPQATTKTWCCPLDLTMPLLCSRLWWTMCSYCYSKVQVNITRSLDKPLSRYTINNYFYLEQCLPK